MCRGCNRGSASETDEPEGVGSPGDADSSGDEVAASTERQLARWHRTAALITGMTPALTVEFSSALTLVPIEN